MRVFGLIGYCIYVNLTPATHVLPNPYTPAPPPALARTFAPVMADNGGRSKGRRPHASFIELHAVASTSRRIAKEGSGNNKPLSMSQALTPNKQTIVRQEEHVPPPREPIELSSFRGGLALSRRRKPSKKDGLRKWAYSASDCSAFKEKAVIVSYNILGVENASRHKDLYHNIPEKYIRWDNRKKLIRKEIILYCPDILCFQEVDRFNDLRHLFRKDGYEGVYKARTGDACDGCAIFWKDSRFTLLYEDHIEFQKFGLRDNIAQFCVMKMNVAQDRSDMTISKSKMNASSSRCMVVGNIHVLFNPNRGDIKLGQVRLFLEKAYELSEAWGGIPVVLAGDLNSVPQSAMYQFLSSEKIDIFRHDRKKISGQIESPLHHRTFNSWTQRAVRPWSNEELELATGDRDATSLENPLKLCSSYHGVPGNPQTRNHMGEPVATSCHSRFMGTVDYIWHTEDLIPVKVLETLPVDILRQIGGLPNKGWGSDHLALVCEFAFT